MENSRNVESVRHLQVLYSTVVGLGLALAIARFIEIRGEVVEVNWQALPVLGAFLVTLIPFYHGAQRHLDDAYLGGKAQRRGHGGLLLADFGFLFLESSLLFALAAFISAPRSFAWTLTILLSVDTLWGVIFYRVTAEEAQGSAELGWAKINAVSVAVLLLLLLLSEIGDREVLLNQLPSGLVVFAIALLRTGADYAKTWSFYFP